MIGNSYLYSVALVVTMLNYVLTGEWAEGFECCPPQVKPLPRRYDIQDLGYPSFFHGWADVQGQGAANDFCRMVGIEPTIYLSCALAGTNGESDYNYQSAMKGFERGSDNTWYMKDEDGDGRDDYCRCVVKEERQQVVCTKAGVKGFHGSAEEGGKSNSFTPTADTQCSSRNVYPELGRPWGFVL